MPPSRRVTMARAFLWALIVLQGESHFHIVLTFFVFPSRSNATFPDNDLHSTLYGEKKVLPSPRAVIILGGSIAIECGVQRHAKCTS